MSDEKRITYAELKQQLDTFTPAQLAQPVVWCGDERGGHIKEVYVHAEDWIGDPGDYETYLPRSEALKQYAADDLESMEVCVPAGTVYLMVD